MLKIIKKKTNLIFLIFAIILSFPAIIGLLHSGFPLTDDGNWMVIRFSAFYEALRNGQFPVRFLTRLNYGYGYPVADFLYPLFMYIGVPIHISGFNFVDTIKAILGASLLFSSIFTFLWLRKLFDNLSSLVGSAFYTLFPYHLFDVYKRGSVGEVLSLSILPFVLWQIERGSLFFTSIGIALLIVAHNTLALLFLPLIFFYILLKQKKFLKFNLLVFIFGFLISSFFWIPALYDIKYTVFSSIQVSDFYNYFIDLNNFEIIGIASLVLLFSSVVLFLINKKTNKLFLYSVALSFLIIFVVTPLSKFLWEIIPLTNLIQFPFRLISLLMILLSFQLGFLLNSLNKLPRNFVAVLFLILIFISAKPYLFPKSYQYFPDSFYSTNQDTTTVKNEYMPKWVKNIPQNYKPERVEILNGREKVNLVSVSSNKIIFNTYVPIKREIQINTVYFPGWKAYINGREVKINYENENGLMRLNLNKGQSNVLLIFKETPIRLFSDLLSIMGVAGLYAFYYLLRKKKINI